MIIPKPICALCGLRVEDVTQDRDIETGETTLTFYCHGGYEAWKVPFNRMALVLANLSDRYGNGPSVFGPFGAASGKYCVKSMM